MFSSCVCAPCCCICTGDPCRSYRLVAMPDYLYVLRTNAAVYRRICMRTCMLILLTTWVGRWILPTVVPSPTCDALFCLGSNYLIGPNHPMKLAGSNASSTPLMLGNHTSGLDQRTWACDQGR